MSTFTEVNKTNNQAHFDYDTSKIFIWSNRYKNVTFLNASGGELSYAPGLVVAVIAATNKVVPFDGSAVNGAQIPVGILKSTITDLANSGEKLVNICIAGDVAEEKVTTLPVVSLDSVVTIGTGTENTRTVRYMIESLQIILKASQELTGFDNQ